MAIAAPEDGIWEGGNRKEGRSKGRCNSKRKVEWRGAQELSRQRLTIVARDGSVSRIYAVQVYTACCGMSRSENVESNEMMKCRLVKAGKMGYLLALAVIVSYAQESYLPLSNIPRLVR